MAYEPKPIDTSKVKHPKELLKLKERLARNAHDLWAQQRMKDGWTRGRRCNDARKEHPDLISYSKLEGTEKKYDRIAAMETLKAIIALGYRIEKKR